MMSDHQSPCDQLRDTRDLVLQSKFRLDAAEEKWLEMKNDQAEMKKDIRQLLDYAEQAKGASGVVTWLGRGTAGLGGGACAIVYDHWNSISKLFEAKG
jgi:hypothetical protein